MFPIISHWANIDEGLGYLKKIPELLNEYSQFSNVLLALLSLAGLLIVTVHLIRRRSSQEGLPTVVIITGAFLLFASIGGFVLKWDQATTREQEIKEFLASHKVPSGEYRLLVFDFMSPSAVSADQNFGGRMSNLVGAISETLLEDLPEGFPQPRVVRVPLVGSPWRQGIDQANFEDVLNRLNAFEIMWGSLLGQGEVANAWLGLSKDLAQGVDTFAPLKDFKFNEDPRRELKFGDGYYRVLGLITLGVALDNFNQAGAATGDERKKKFLQAVDRFNQARQLVSNRREDRILEKTVFSKKVDELIHVGLREAGLIPQ